MRALVRRRTFLRRVGSLGFAVAVGPALSACGVATPAMPSFTVPGTPLTPKVPLVSFLSKNSQPELDAWLPGLRQGMQDLGHVEGRSFRLEYRAHQGRDGLQALAADIVAQQPGVIVVEGLEALAAAKAAAGDRIPIVVVGSGDLLGSGLVLSAARPGGNVTGISVNPRSLAAKRLELLRALIPDLARAAVFWNPNNPQSAAELADAQAAAQHMQLELVPVDVRRSLEVPAALEAVQQAGAGALYILSDTVFADGNSAFVDRARRRRLPTMCDGPWLVERGGLVCYATDARSLAPRSAWYVDRILKGANPSELPVEEPSQFTLVVNLYVAEAMGLSVPAQVLQQATRVLRPAPAGPRVASVGFNPQPVRSGLRQLGWTDGENMTLRWWRADIARSDFAEEAADLARQGVDFWLTRGIRSTNAARSASPSTPVVMLAFADPVESGLVDSLQRPNTDLTGVVIWLPELKRAQLAMLREIWPDLKRVGYVAPPFSNPDDEIPYRHTQAAADRLGVKIHRTTLERADQLEGVFDEAAREGIEVLLFEASRVVWPAREQIGTLAMERRMPTLFDDREFVVAGGLLSIEVDELRSWDHTFAVLDRVMRGTSPADLPFRLDAETRLIVNLRAANAIGLTIPPAVLERADEIVK